MTRYANEILRIINASNSHLTAEQIFLEIKRAEPQIVLATVYNNLKALNKKGLIRILSVDGKTDRYDKIKKHDHLVCKTCGKLADFQFEDLAENLSKQINFDVFGYDLKVFYECTECQNIKNNLK